jgi:hypothetical protein
MKSHPARWTDQDFDSLSWHDNHIHGIRIRNPHEGYDFDLILDIDHILKWVVKPDNSFEFVLAPATLTFHGVHKLNVDFQLAYREDLEISDIERTEITTEAEHGVGIRRFAWQIKSQSIAGRPNRICFEARGFTQELRREPVVRVCQRLEEEER